MTIMYCDCYSGISGDMLLSAMLDAGLPLTYLEEHIAALKLRAYRGVQVQDIQKGALKALSLQWLIEEEQQHRHLGDIEEIIQSSCLPAEVKAVSLTIFQRLAQAEAQVHGTDIQHVHFHEVGALDSILDIVGAAIGLHYFGVKQLYSSALPLGSGTIKSQHGLLPLPAPAVMVLLQQAGAPLRPSSAEEELVTPTGAAILSSLAVFEQPSMTLQRFGIGAGKRDFPWPNVLRLLIGEPIASSPETFVELITNIDDMNPQAYQHIMQRLFDEGALDVYLTPIIMKKSRPATRLSVIAKKQDEAHLADLLLRETTTFGIRVIPIYHRYEASREVHLVATPIGEAQVKLKKAGSKIVQIAPEYDAVEKLAKESSLTWEEVYWMVKEAAQKYFGIEK